MIFVFVHALFIGNVVPGTAASTNKATNCRPSVDPFKNSEKYDCYGETGYFTITIVKHEKLILQCHQKSYIRSENLEAPSVLSPELDDFIVSDCPLQNESLVSILQKFGVKSTRAITLKSVKNLSHLHLTELNSTTFLTINGANIFTANMLTCLPKLEKLILVHTSIDYGVFSNKTNNQLSLVSLELERCNIHLYFDKIHPVFSSLGHLKHLVIKSIYVAQINKSLFDGLIALELLELINNTITSIPNNSFSSISQLKKLTIHGSKIKELPPKLFSGLYNLTCIKMTYNKFKKLPHKLLQDQRKLETLDLSYNILEILPSGMFSYLGNLKELILNYNKLRILSSKAFSGLKNVEYISIQNNLLEFISDQAFNDTYSLKKLVLDNNNLSFNENLKTKSKGYNESPLHKLSRLKILSLKNNRIFKVFHDWKHELTELKSLHLSGNDFEDLKEEDIDFQQENIEINFKYNNIASVSIKNTTIGINLILEENPLRCDCNMYKFALYLHTHPEKNGLYCSEPPNFAKMMMRNIPLMDFTCVLPNCPETCQCIDTPGAQLKTQVVCDTLPSPGEFDKYNILDTSLQLRQTPSNLKNLSENVKFLNLSDLSLTVLPQFPQPLKLGTIDLSNNKLKQVPSDLLSTNGPYLLLLGNNFTCECANSQDIARLQNFKKWVVDYNIIKCDNRLLGFVETATLCRTLNNKIIGAILATVGVIFLITATIFFRYKHNSKIKYFWWCYPHDKENEINILYDAFVSYTHSDSTYVLEKLVPGLENISFKLCLHQRDWIAGDWIPTQIVRSILQSRRTIVVLSQNSMTSEWVLREFKAANDISKRDRLPRVIVILLGEVDEQKLDPELRAYVLKRTYIRADDECFWKKMKSALLDQSTSKLNFGLRLLQRVHSTPILQII